MRLEKRVRTRDEAPKVDNPVPFREPNVLTHRGMQRGTGRKPVLEFSKGVLCIDPKNLRGSMTALLAVFHHGPHMGHRQIVLSKVQSE